MSETPVKIGLWGAPSSGKTAFLGALAIAVVRSGGQGRSRSRVGSWSISGKDPESVDYLYQRKKEMMVEGRFPENTHLGIKSPVLWGFAGLLAWSEFDKRPRPLRHKELRSDFELDVIDVQGAVYDRRPGQADGADTAASAAFEHLEHAEGLIYLFDPITELDNHDAINYVDGTIEELKSRAYRQTGKPSRYLHHELAVCVTKFDHRKMYQRARKMNFVFDGPDGMPVVPDEHAERFFDDICSGDFWPKSNEDDRELARLVRDRLYDAFDPERIKYYVTSSIGFAEKDSAAEFDGDRFQANYEGNKILGEVRPINVLEPLIRLQQRIARQQRR